MQHETCPYCKIRQPDIFTAIDRNDLEFFKFCLDMGQAERFDLFREERPVHRLVGMDQIQMVATSQDRQQERLW